MIRQQNKNVVMEVFKSIVDEATDGYMISDANGTIIYVNKEYIKICALPAENLIGRNMQEFIEDGSLKESLALQVMQTRQQMVRPLMIRKQIPLSITSTPVFNTEGNLEYVVTVTQDISLLRNTKHKLDNLMQFLRNYKKDKKNTPAISQEGFVTRSQKANQVFELADKIKNIMPNVIIYGESGVGKEVIARYIHNSGQRKNGPFISVNCGAIPEPLLETELFGYTGGSFTGANRAGKPGLFEAAEGGTLFLDEVADMSFNLQVKLLRVLENKAILRVGEHNERPVDVRIISATNKNLKDMVRNKHFREDLYYRLNVLPIDIPPLRERIDDIIPITLYYLQKFNNKYGLEISISDSALKLLEQYQWPGNIRELRNIIERLVVTSDNNEIQQSDIALFLQDSLSEPPVPAHDVIVKNIIPLEQAIACVERQLLQKAKIKNKSCRKIADALGINYSTVARKLQQYNL